MNVLTAKRSFIFSIILLVQNGNEAFTTSNVKISVDSYTAVNTIEPRFLSLALDSRLIKNSWCRINWRKLTVLAEALAPAYLRVGGIDADGLIFNPNASEPKIENESQNCTLQEKNEIKNFTMSAQTWDRLNMFSRKAKLDLIFDLNLLLRNKNRTWNYENAKQLLTYSQKRNFSLNFELGNEPDHLRVHSNFSESAQRLAVDYQRLEKLLSKYRLYNSSLIIGPSTTQFLKHGGANVVDAATFHHYYFDGKNATIEQFLDPWTFDSLISQINVALNVTKKYSPVKKMQIWLGETASAYGAGAPGLSDSFVSTFIWIDKLGLAALGGINVVIRQSLFRGAYALVDNNTDPNPDYWLSLIYKRLFLPNVVKLSVTTDEKQDRNFVRFYAHCFRNRMTIFGMNLLNKTAKIYFDIRPAIKKKTKLYLFTATNLKSRDVFLNDAQLSFDGRKLPSLNGRYVQEPIYLPKFSLAFFELVLEQNECDSTMNNVLP